MFVSFLFFKTKSEREPEKRGNEFVDSGIPEAYDIGHDYAKYTSSITPGEKNYSPKHQGGPYKPSKQSDNLINVNIINMSLSLFALFITILIYYRHNKKGIFYNP